jgi:hypothetical protein
MCTVNTVLYIKVLSVEIDHAESGLIRKIIFKGRGEGDFLLIFPAPPSVRAIKDSQRLLVH